MPSDRRELPTERKEFEEQTNDDNNLDNCVHHLVRPQAVMHLIKVTTNPAPISAPTV